jgi:hypothetical protein
MNYLDAFEEIYALRHPQVNAVVGIAGKGFAYNATDRLWAAYKLGEKYNVKDPDTGVWSVRNIFYDKANSNETVKALQARGAIFWMCNNALNRLSKQWAEEAMKSPEDVKKDLVAGLNPGVIIVPCAYDASRALPGAGLYLPNGLRCSSHVQKHSYPVPL